MISAPRSVVVSVIFFPMGLFYYSSANGADYTISARNPTASVQLRHTSTGQKQGCGGHQGRLRCIITISMGGEERWNSRWADLQNHSPLGIHLPLALFVRLQKARSYQRILDRNAAADKPLEALRSTGQVQRRAGTRD